MIYKLNELSSLSIDIKSPYIIFLKGDLWAWKTTLSKHILNNFLWIEKDITSPTYTYYNRYFWELNWKEMAVYHFDLYRLWSYEEFVAIWAEEIFDNNNWIILVEWPDLLKDYYKADVEIFLKNYWNPDERGIDIVYK